MIPIAITFPLYCLKTLLSFILQVVRFSSGGHHVGGVLDVPIAYIHILQGKGAVSTGTPSQNCAHGFQFWGRYYVRTYP